MCLCVDNVDVSLMRAGSFMCIYAFMRVVVLPFKR